MRTALKWTGLALFFVFLTLLFIYVTFPTERIARVGELKLAEALGADRVEIRGLSLAGFGGLSADSVMVELPPVKVPTLVPGGWEWGPARLILLEDVELDVGVADLLSVATGGGLDAQLDAKLQKGTLENMQLTWAPEEGRLALSIGRLSDVAIGSEQLFQALVGYDISGRLSGALSMEVPVEGGRVQVDQMKARADLTIAGAKLHNPQFDHPSLGRVRLSDADLGEVTIRVEVDEAKNLAAFAKRLRGQRADHTVIHAAEVKISGPDLEIELSDESAITFQPGRPISESALNVHMGIRITDAFIEKSVPDPNDPEKMTQPNSMIRFALEQRPIKPVMQNGAFGLALTGTLGNPQVRWERPRGIAGFVTRKVNLGGGEEDEEDVEEEPEDVEDPEAGAVRRVPGAQPTTIRTPTTTATPIPATRIDPGSDSDRPAIRRPNLVPRDDMPTGRRDGGIPGIPQAPPPDVEPPPLDEPYEEAPLEEPYDDGHGVIEDPYHPLDDPAPYPPEGELLPEDEVPPDDGYH